MLLLLSFSRRLFFARSEIPVGLISAANLKMEFVYSCTLLCEFFVKKNRKIFNEILYSCIAMYFPMQKRKSHLILPATLLLLTLLICGSSIPSCRATSVKWTANPDDKYKDTGEKR